jgi:two-component system chemotaxis response regulator CheB
LTLDALACGASDYITKPTTSASDPNPFETVRTQLLTRIRVLLRRGQVARSAPVTPPPMPRPKPAPPPERRVRTPVEVLVVGASTGGPNALGDLLAALPATFAPPIVIVQHMPPLFTRLFAERLDSRLPFRVREVVSGAAIQGGEVWIAPGDHHVVLGREGERLVVRTHQGPPENSCRPACDVLFRSAAEHVGPATLTCVLTGMGSDGLLGAERIRAAGGEIVVQDEATSVVWSMPGAIATAGLADAVLPLPDIANELTRRVAQRRSASRAPRESGTS